MDELSFLETELEAGELVTVAGQVNRAWGTSMEVGVLVLAERLIVPAAGSDGAVASPDAVPYRRMCRAYFTFVALDGDGQKLRLPSLSPTDPDSVAWHAAAQERRRIRFARKDIVRLDCGVAGGGGGTTCSSGGLADQPAARPTQVLTTTEVVLPLHANHMHNTFGGAIMDWMSVAARVVACRHARGADKVAVQSIDDVFFVAPSKVGDKIEISARVNRVFGLQLDVGITVMAYSLDGERRLINRAIWVLRASSRNADFAVPDVAPGVGAEASTEFGHALGRRALRLSRKALHGPGPTGDTRGWQWDTASAGELSVRVATRHFQLACCVPPSHRVSSAHVTTALSPGLVPHRNRPETSWRC